MPPRRSSKVIGLQRAKPFRFKSRRVYAKALPRTHEVYHESATAAASAKDDGGCTWSCTQGAPSHHEEVACNAESEQEHDLGSKAVCEESEHQKNEETHLGSNDEPTDRMPHPYLKPPKPWMVMYDFHERARARSRSLWRRLMPC